MFLFFEIIRAAPVKIVVCNVNESLVLSDDEGDDMTQHIVGTHIDDLTQIYNGRVAIRGSLTFNNLLVASNRDNFFSQPIHIDTNSMDPVQQENQAKIEINNMPFDIEKVSKRFWMKSIDQVRDERQSRIRVMVSIYFFILFYE